MNYVREYWERISSGEIVTSKRVKAVYGRLVAEMDAADESSPYYFDEAVGERPITFVERFCKQSQGTLGESLTLELFQKAFIQLLFGWLERATGYRRFRETLFLVGRKNGKSIKKLNEGKAEKAASPTAGNFAGLDSSGNLTDSGKKPGDFADASHTHTGKADKVKNVTAGHFAGLDSSGNLTDSGKKPGDFANASHAHAGYAEVKIFSGVSVAASAWVSDSTYAAYPYAASIACPGVTASHVPEVVFGATEAASGNFAPVALSGSGTVKIYAATKPTAAITVQSITCIKAVS